MIIYCNSGGCAFEKGHTEIENNLQAKYLLSKGYAVMCMAGLPESYSGRLKIDRARTAGSHITHRACIAGYEYVLSRYNLRRDGCFLLSVSTGGLAALNLLNLSDIPVLAAAGINPLTSTAENAWFVPSGSASGGEFDSLQYRSNIIRIFGMKDARTLSELRDARYEKDKVGVYDPYDYCLNQSDKPSGPRIWCSATGMTRW